jgi:threonine/homoserine/homoserine lactone efflux protein
VHRRGIGINVSLLLLEVGLAEVFSRFSLMYEVLRYAGAAYMAWLAWRISGIGLPRLGRSSSPAGTAEEKQKVSSVAELVESKRREGVKPLGYVEAFFFQIVNVKVWLTNIIIVSAYVGTGDGRGLRLLAAVVLFTCMGTSAMCCWAAGGTVMQRFLTSDGMRRANYVFALFLLCSIALFFI